MEFFKKHKILSVVLAFLVIGIIAAAAGGSDTTDTANGSNSESSESATAEDAVRFTDRADIQDGDVEVLPGEAATVGGVQMTLSGVETKQSINEFDSAASGNVYLIADVSIENTSDETQAYNVFDFRIQTAGGQVLDGAFTTLEGTLGSGDLVSGGTTTGKVVFEVPVEEGNMYVLWKPNAFNADRAVVQVNQ